MSTEGACGALAMPWPTATQWLDLQRAVWPRILREATEKGQTRRAEFAAWMLRDTLETDTAATRESLPDANAGDAEAARFGQSRLL